MSCLYLFYPCKTQRIPPHRCKGTYQLNIFKMQIPSCIRTLIKVEALILYGLLWICLMTVHFQLNFIPKHYLKQTQELAQEDFEQRRDNRDNDNHDNNATKKVGQVYTGPSSAEVMKWFIHGPKLVQLPLQSRKHPHLVSYDVQKEVCHRGAVHLLIYIQSVPQNTHYRDEIRNTWGGVHNFKEIYVERVFLVAETEDKRIMESLEKERKEHDDIIICHFKDTFKNLSLKAITLLDFVNNRCTQAKYILKVDDDIFVNVYSLVEKFVPLLMKKPKSIVCQCKYNHKLVLDRNSKWYIPPEVLSESDKGILPTFCSGYVVLFTSDLVPMLLDASYTVPLVPVDDVYVFGFLLKKVADVNFIDGSDSFTLNQELGMDEYQNKTKPIQHCVVSVSEKATHETLWENTIDKISPFGREIMNKNLLPYEY
ncbi:beta-1,3-galactosyltransferase 1-like [Pecten maximus]|uniref:beta-1,3-galactosyltransferase 1-like n=1 Tax=Pecten maximus TaxID=6579 RepID=UPI001458D4A9|nr:beta-1,3-galactosyltransferase 1-like [Pecten maximus]